MTKDIGVQPDTPWPRSETKEERARRFRDDQGFVDWPPSPYEIYEHHGRMVWVQSDLKGKHRDHCLCWNCDKLKPGQPDNCPIAQKLYAICVEHGTVNPVYECPEFQPK